MESLYTRYASALVSIAKDENKLKEYKIAISNLDAFLLANEEAKKLLESYFVDFEDKVKFIDELTKEYKLINLSNYIKLITKKHLMFHFHDIALAINKQINNELNIDEGFVYSVNRLSDKELSNIEEAVSKKLNQKVELQNKLDSRLIGGIKVVVHDHVFDGSILGKLETLKNTLKERRIS